ncbi:MAG TPA: hypothetical protein V6C65_32110 [Allocoleopsis sp.]
MMNRQAAITFWLRSLDYGALVQLQQQSGYRAIEGIACWMEETDWLPEDYDPEFPYPQILPGRYAVGSIELN